MKPFKKALIVEFSFHYRILSHIYSFFKKEFDEVDTIIYKNRELVEQVPSNRKENIKNQNTIYWKLLFRARKYDLVFIQTGPEWRDWFSNIAITFGFYLFTLFYKKKIILHIRNIDRYQIKGFSTGYFLRHLALKNVKCLTFDSIQIENNFKKSCKNAKNFSTAVIPCYFSDIKSSVKPRIDKSGIEIGLISIDPRRKDYDLFYDILHSLNEDQREKITVVLVGNCESRICKGVAKMFERIVKVKYIPKILNDEEFISLSNECDIFLTPLRKSFGYGKTMESATYGDAIFLKRKVIVPKFSCKSKEFDEIAIYYNNKKELLNIIISLLENRIDLNIKDSFLQSYSREAVMKRLKHSCKEMEKI